MSGRSRRSIGPPPPPPPPPPRKRVEKNKGDAPTQGGVQPPPLPPTAPPPPPTPQVSQQPAKMPGDGQMEEEMNKRVEQMVRDGLAAAKTQRDEETKQLNDRLKELQVRLDAGSAETEKDTAKTLKEVSKVLQGFNPPDEDLRKPTAFRQPTFLRGASKFFCEFERYCKVRYRNHPDPHPTYLPTFLAGKVQSFYDRQAPDIKDDYLAIKDKIGAYCVEAEAELRMETLKPHDAKIPLMDYLEEAHEFFMAKGVDEEQSICDLQMHLAPHLQRAITIHKPKTWSEACRWVRDADNDTAIKSSKHELQAMMAERIAEAAPTIAKHCGTALEDRLASLEDKLTRQAEEQAETTLAVMGSRQPTYHKPNNSTKPPTGRWPTMPNGHIVNDRYRGNPEDYDPYFRENMKAKREQNYRSRENNGRSNNNGNNSNSGYNNNNSNYGYNNGQQQQQQLPQQHQQQQQRQYQQPQQQQQPADNTYQQFQSMMQTFMQGLQGSGNRQQAPPTANNSGTPQLTWRHPDQQQQQNQPRQQQGN